jgi:GMP synthase (glutamine-hydrolysing)
MDFGGQYCHLIARRVRENGVYSEIVANDITAGDLEGLKSRLNVRGLILSGGPSSIYEDGAPKMDRQIVDSGIPILGICYGHQLLASYLGCNVVRAHKQEYGSSYANIKLREGVLKDMSAKEDIWMSHGDTVLSVPNHIKVMATTENCPVAAFMHESLPIFGVQWHPEVVHTKHGDKILSAFIFDVCKCRPTWNAQKTVPKYVDDIKAAIGDSKAIIALSGGVDSSTAALLASRAIGKNLTAVFVDNGLMREGEAASIAAMAKNLNINLVSVDASKEFLGALSGVSDPEQKRKIIGREFIRTFERVASGINAQYLIQGTIYPDRIESGHSKKSSVIKTHHNVGGLPTEIKFKGIVEPLRDLYKDEVRKVATSLGMPEEMVHRQPFPGPGLAVRVLGDVTVHKLDILRKADAIVTAELSKSEANKRLWQYFAVFPGIKSTGVKGDSRAYGYVITIRAVESREAMTASFAELDWPLLRRISTLITNQVPEIVRVTYDITDKPPGTIEWE